MGLIFGETCPYCNKIILPTDDVVLCSDCCVPHHRDCWMKNHGCTTFDCIGRTQELQPDERKKEILYCPQCGAPNLRTASFCANCGSDIQHALVTAGCTSGNMENGTRQQPYTAASPSCSPAQGAYDPSSQYAAGVTAAYTYAGEEAALIRWNIDYYQRQFFQLRAGHKKTSWNWCAFLFPVFWFLYRKMYIECLIVTLLTCCLQFTRPFASLLSLAVCCAAGVTGNWLYLNKIEKEVLKARAMTGEEKEAFILKKRGTSKLPVIIVLVFVLLISAIILLEMIVSK